MQIQVLCVGKIKEKYLISGIDEYCKRLSRYCKLFIIEVADEKTPDKASEREEELIREKEALRIKKYLHTDAYRIALAIDGKHYDSVQFAKHIHQIGLMGKGQIQFIIGGSLGLHSTILEEADEKISFSEMTFPHQLMRMILLEQVYRGYRITNGEPYHK